MYLSRLILNPASKQVREDLSDCQALHRTILGAFPPAPAGAARQRHGVLYRVDLDPRLETAAIYVQSGCVPDWSRLADGYLAETNGDPTNPACKSVGDQYAAIGQGTMLRFRLRANPTRKIDTKTRADGVHSNGRRVELRREADQLAWLSRKASEGGFELVSVKAASGVPDVRAVPEQPSRGAGKPVKVKGERQRQQLTFGSVLYEGHLRVIDPERFRKTLAAGIGSGKAYGFGLLSVAPA